MSRDDPRGVTRLLRRWRDGDEAAMEALMPLVYDELRHIAGGLMRGERQDHTLRATALVHEAWLRLAGSDAAVDDRVHFVSLAARVMRRVLVDYARARRAEKRGGERVRVTLADVDAVVPDSMGRMLEIEQALERLGELDPRKLRVLELSIFGGLTQAQIAEVERLALSTVERDLRIARAWVRTEIEQG